MSNTDENTKHDNNTASAIDAGVGLASISGRLTDVMGLPVALVPNGMKLQLCKNEIDLADARAEAPRRQRGTAVLTELASFIAHVNRHKDESSAVFADTASVRLTAVLNYNVKGQAKPRWCDLRAVYSCPLSDAWKLWTANSGKKMGQEAFAQFIEDHMEDLASPTGNGDDKDLPTPGEVLTMARHLHIRSEGTFSRTINPTTGESSLITKNENTQDATRIPRAFLLQLQVFEAGAHYAVQARMRFEFVNNAPCFSYLLYRADEIKRDAFGVVRTMVEQQTALPLFAGAPEA